MRARVFVASLLALVLSVALVHGQEQVWSSPYPLRLSYARALAMATAADRRLPYVPGEVLIKFKPGVSVSGQQRALQAVRSQPRAAALRWVRDVAVLRDSREQDATILAAQLSEQPEVEYAEPNRLYRVHATPNDPGFSQQQWNLSAIDMPRAWDINPGASPSVTVAVIDTGMTTVNATFPFRSWNGTAISTIQVPFATNPDLRTSRLTHAKDFVFWDGPVLDLDGHGTHVGGTVGEDTNNGLAEAGMAYNASIMPLKACIGFWEVQFILSANGQNGFAPFDAGGCPDDALIEAIEYAADSGAQVINLSIGSEQPSTRLRQAIQYAVGRGAVVTISAGNEFEDGNPTEYPAFDAASIDGALSVAAVGPTLARSYYSNTGAWIEITAPGGDFRVDGADGLIWQAGISSTDFDPHRTVTPRFDLYYQIGLQGTSMSAPHVAGLAALLISQGVTSPAAVEALIKASARDLGAPGKDNDFGYGLIQPRAALFGFGVVK